MTTTNETTKKTRRTNVGHGLATSSQRDALHQAWGGECAWCGCEVRRAGANFDHIAPSAKGGSDALTNLALSCVPCNCGRGKQDAKSWLALALFRASGDARKSNQQAAGRVRNVRSRAAKIAAQGE